MKDISVIIPVYNGEKTIERCLASLISNKEYIKEIIIVDDHSTDNTISLVNPYDIIFENLIILKSEGIHNPGLARKTGLVNATGEYVTFLDADDCLTASSLKYVSRALSDTTLLLCCKSIYYESGNFTPETIDYADTSCGGNFYNREFVIENAIFPDDELKLVEDEFFNEKVIKYIQLNNSDVEHFDYPVYEVHHDIGDGLSYALSHWVDYLCKYRLLYKQKYVQEFKGIADKEELRNEYLNNLIFCFFLAEGLILDQDIEFKLEDNRQYFKQAIYFFEREFGENYLSIIDYFEKQPELMHDLWRSSTTSVGFVFENFLDFRQFIISCLL